MDEDTFALGAGSVVSYAELGPFKINDGKLIATSRCSAFVFEIKDSKALIVLDTGDNELFRLPENAEYVFGEDTH